VELISDVSGFLSPSSGLMDEWQAVFMKRERERRERKLGEL
jgi:hypothetical protein